MSDEIKLVEQRQKDFESFMGRAIANIKSEINNLVDEAAQDINASYAPFIDTDAWTNYRSYLMKELKGGAFKEVSNTTEGHWAKNVRDMIFHEHKDELIAAINQDLLREIDKLKRDLNDSYRRY
jgi:hypothetical protein